MSMLDTFNRNLRRLTEQTVNRPYDITPEQIQQVVQQIKTECGPWLKQSGGTLVYRGQSDKGAITRMPVRTDRRPLDSTTKGHNALIDMIKAIGLTANRDNSIFVTPRPTVASAFGGRNGQRDTYIVFPVGKFNYTWTAVTDDAMDVPVDDESIMTLALSDYSKGSAIDKIREQIATELEQAAGIEDLRQRFYSIAPNNVYLDASTTRRFASQVGSSSDHYLKTAAHQALAERSDTTKAPVADGELESLEAELIACRERIFDIVEPRLKDIRASLFQGDDGSLQDALKSGHELMIHCKEVILVSAQFKTTLLDAME